MTTSASSPRIAHSVLHLLLRPPIRYHGLSGSILRFGSVSNVDRKDEINEVKQRSVTVHAAYQFLQAGHHYLDVRTSEEFRTGHPSGAINIPYMFTTEAGRIKNAKFLGEVASRFEKDNKILIGCQSGKRSLMAAADLQSAGYTDVIDVAGGYSAWKENGLPTTM
ncbi:hypothetical protein SLA2020_089020 [Shorea laevis]